MLNPKNDYPSWIVEPTGTFIAEDVYHQILMSRIDAAVGVLKYTASDASVYLAAAKYLEQQFTPASIKDTKAMFAGLKEGTDVRLTNDAERQ